MGCGPNILLIVFHLTLILPVVLLTVELCILPSCGVVTEEAVCELIFSVVLKELILYIKIRQILLTA